MTHGDKAKAKTGKSSQASAAAKKSSPPVKEAAGKAVQGKSGGKVAPKGDGKGEQARTGKIAVKKAGAEKGSPAPAEKSGAGAGKEGGGSAKAAKAATREAEPGSFSNPVIGNAFKHALKKYPNALRKLTD